MFTGGIAGINYGSIINTKATVVFQPEAYDTFGGITGWNLGEIIRSSAHVEINGGYQGIGGIAGWNDSGLIEDCYATGQIHAKTFMGGLTGGSNGIVKNSYSTVAITTETGPSNFGGLIGSLWDTPEVTNSYWDTQTSFLAISPGGGEGKTTSEMKNINTYVDWDFEDVWAISPEINNGYPYLRALSDY